MESNYSPSTNNEYTQRANQNDCALGQRDQEIGYSSFESRIHDKVFCEKLDKYSIEDVVELKISRFLDHIGKFQLENVHDLIISKVEKSLLVQILRRVGGNQVQAAKILGINRNTLRKKIKHYGI